MKLIVLAASTPHSERTHAVVFMENWTEQRQHMLLEHVRVDGDLGKPHIVATLDVPDGVANAVFVDQLYVTPCCCGTSDERTSPPSYKRIHRTGRSRTAS